MFRPRQRNIAAAAPGSARRGRNQPDRPKRVWNFELERLEIRITPATRTWTGLGGDGNWTTAANWDVAPAANDDLVFPDIADSAGHTAVNDFAAGTPFGSIRIGEAGYTLSGNAISQPGGLIATYASGTSTYNIATTLSSSFPNTVQVDGGTLVLGGALSGANGISKQGAGLALFTQANSYAGATTVSAGTLAIANSSALGSSTAGNGTTVASGATLEIRGTINTSEPVTIVGTGVNGVGSLFNGTGNNVVQSVNLTADATIGVATGTFMLIPSTLGESGGTGFNLTKAGAGVLDVLATATYTGATTVAGGTLAVEGTVTSPIAVNTGATVAGAGGNLGDVTSTGGTFNPGFSSSPFTTDADSLTLDAASTFVVSLAGNTPGNGSTGYSRLNTFVSSLGGATLSLSIGGGYTPAPGDALTIISNTEDVSGTFNGLPEGGYVSLGAGRTFRITYQGGSGSDVVLNYVDDTTTGLTSSANPAAPGQPVTFTATVAPVRVGGPVPTGTVSFLDGATPLGTAPLVNGVATFPTSALTTGSHSITAVFNGDSGTAPSTSAPLTQDVSLPASATSLTAAPNPSVFGQSVTFAATVTAVTPATGTPTGSVTFFDGATLLGTVPLVAGVAEFATATLAVGDHSITASYAGDSGFTASLSTATTQTVNRASLNATLVSSANPTNFGQDVTLTATFIVAAPGVGTPTGTVTFFDGETPIGTVTLDGNGVASIVIASLGAGTHSIVASYAGDAAFSPAETAPLSLVVTPPVTGTVFLDTNANAVQDPGEPGLPGRVVFLDQNGDGILEPGEPTATTAADGSFSLTGGSPGSVVVEALGQDTYFRNVVSQTRTLADGSVTLGVVPFSPIAPVAVVPDPFVVAPPADANTAFVESLYRAVLGRSGGEGEVQSWVVSMAQGTDRAAVTRGFVNSPEHRSQQVEEYYQTFLGRSTDPTAQGWVVALQSGASEESVVEGILNSAEYQEAHQDPAALVQDLYLEVLGRQGEDAGLAGFEAMLTSGASRASVVSLFVQSAEAVDQILDGFYSSYLRRGRDPLSGGWEDELLSPSGSATAVAIGILASDEFFEAAGRGGI